MKSETNQPMQVVNRAFDLLELLASESTPIQTTDLAERLGVSVQNANNLLRVLFRRGYVSQDQSRRYRLGPQLCIFGDATARWERLRKVMEPVLINLNRASGFGAFAGVLENDRLYCFAHILPNGEPAPLTQQSWTEELYSTATGRVLLAALSSRERKKLFARKTRREITAKAVTDPAELAKICLDIQKAGYAEMKEESRDGICSIAVPVRDFSGTVIAGLGLYGPTATWETTTSAQKKALMKSCLDLLEK
jgi:IclR family pca regulon transcriptional regulator